MEKEFNFVYITTNAVNGKQYIGDHSTNNLENDRYLGSGSLFVNKVNEYGQKNFSREILEYFPTKKEAFDAQEKYIRLYKTHVSENGYNVSWKGGHGVKDCISDETKEKLSKAGKNKPKTDIHKKHISEANKGQISWNKGKPGPKPSEQSRKKMSDSAKGKTMSEESKQKNREKHLGKNLSEETKNKMSESSKNRWKYKRDSFNRSEETNKKISESLKGKIGYWKDKNLSEATKEKMRLHKGKNKGPITEKRRLAIIEGIKKKNKNNLLYVR
jgi:group I intron endonuclease